MVYKFNENFVQTLTEGTIYDTTVDRGAIYIECAPDGHVEKVREKIVALDKTNDVLIPFNEIEYTHGHPRDCIKYSDLVTEHYYYDMQRYRLYRYNKGYRNPWLIQKSKLVAVNGEPSIMLDPTAEDFNISDFYYNATIFSTTITFHKYAPVSGWSVGGTLLMLPDHPAELDYDPETTDYSVYYYDASQGDVIKLDPFQYLEEVEFDSLWYFNDKPVIYERPFNYFREFMRAEMDFTDLTKRVTETDNNGVEFTMDLGWAFLDKLVAVCGNPNDIKDLVPEKQRVYMDTNGDFSYYRYDFTNQKYVKLNDLELPYVAIKMVDFIPSGSTIDPEQLFYDNMYYSTVNGKFYRYIGGEYVKNYRHNGTSYTLSYKDNGVEFGTFEEVEPVNGMVVYDDVNYQWYTITEIGLTNVLPPNNRYLPFKVFY